MPALVLAEQWPASQWHLVEVMQRRAAFLRAAVRDLGMDGRVVVDERRAEDVGRDAALRGSFDLVTARGFGPPPVTAECAAPLLRHGGVLVVSEPPEDDATRWPADGLAQLGFDPPVVVAGRARFVRILLTEPCPVRYPRRVGLPAKRPLW